MRLLICIISVCFVPGVALAQDNWLVKDGHSDYSIVVAPDAPPAVRRGAQEIQKYVEQMSGAKLPIVAPSQPLPDRAIVIRSDANTGLGPDDFRCAMDQSRQVITGGG